MFIELIILVVLVAVVVIALRPPGNRARKTPASTVLQMDSYPGPDELNANAARLRTHHVFCRALP